MDVKEFKYKTKRDGFYRKFFKSINGIMNLTDREMDVISKLYEYLAVIKTGVSDNAMANELLFSTGYRQKIREDLNVSSLLLNNYIKSLKDKKIIVEKNKVKSLNEYLEIDMSKEAVVIKFNFTFDD